MVATRVTLLRSVLGRGIFGVLATAVGGGACVVDDVPACPGRCFEHTIQYAQPRPCQDAAAQDYLISFNGDDPDGYRGEVCFNSSSVAHVIEAIDHLRAGGQLSDLALEVQSAYVSTVDAVKEDLQAECTTAAPGQCINAEQICTGIAADMYEQLIVDQICVLELGGVEPVGLAPGQACVVIDQGLGSTDSGEPCAEASTTSTTGGGGADESSGDG